MQENIDFSALSVGELERTIEQAQKAKLERIKAEKEQLKKEVLALVKSRGYTISDIFPRSPGLRQGKAKEPLPITHQDPQNPANTWTGRGRKPAWLKDKIEQGYTLQSFLVS